MQLYRLAYNTYIMQYVNGFTISRVCIKVLLLYTRVDAAILGQILDLSIIVLVCICHIMYFKVTSFPCSGHELAILYHDQSVLESHHLAVAIRTLRVSDCVCHVFVNLIQWGLLCDTGSTVLLPWQLYIQM